MRCGATLVTSESPIGDRYSSPMVSTNVVPASHSTLRLVSSVAPAAATIITMYDSPSRKQPIAILVTLLGSLPCLDWPAQNIVSSGANAKIMSGLNAWNHDDGMLQPNRCQFVFWSAHSCIVFPCCS